MRDRIRRIIGRVAGSLDVQRVAHAVRSPGIDTRLWFSAATVGVQTAEGELDVTDPQAVYADRTGHVADLQLQPSGDFITARWNGIGVGRFGSMLVPLVPGDNVVVAIPDGDLNSPGITIIAMLSDLTALIPADWNNERVLFDTVVPVQIRAPQIRLDSPILQLNGRIVYSNDEGI